MSFKENIPYYVIIIVILFAFYSAISFLIEKDKELGIEKQLQIDNVLKLSSNLEQHKFLLKETKVENLISGNMKGSFLLIGGLIYGEIKENKYLYVVYFDDDKIIDNTTNVYKITKFDIESIEIVTIPKNETPYYKFIENSYQRCFWGDTDYVQYNIKYKVKIGNPRLFLSEGWVILNN